MKWEAFRFARKPKSQARETKKEGLFDSVRTDCSLRSHSDFRNNITIWLSVLSNRYSIRHMEKYCMIWLILRIKTFSLILQYLVTVRKCGRQNLEVSCLPSIISLIEDECMTPLSVSGYFSFKLLKNLLWIF